MESDAAKRVQWRELEAEEEKRVAMLREEQRRKIEAEYADLPPLPPDVPGPEYMVQGAPAYSRNAASRGFYSACAQGRIDEVREFIGSQRPSTADLSYGLEEASHGFQPEVVRYLMREQNAKLHTRVFERRTHTRVIPLEDRPPQSSQNIFTGGRPELFDLLKALIDHGWHPNQNLGPLKVVYIPERVLQDVALHYPRCIQDMEILKLLLDSGADPTIAREKMPVPFFSGEEPDAPVERKSGDILHMAVNIGTIETVNLLLSHGAKFEYGAPLHSLVRRDTSETTLGQIYPPVDLATRCKMGDHLLDLGVDINAIKNVFQMVRLNSYIALPYYYEGTPLSHALGSRDWDFVEWLLEKGADPEADTREDKRDEFIYGFEYGHSEKDLKANEERLQSLIQKVRKRKGRGV